MVVVRRLTLLLAAALLCSPALTHLSAQDLTGTIRGVVVDSATNLPTADVSVVVEGTRRGAITNNDGSYVIGGVPAGTYTVRARRIGFGAPAQTVTVTPGGTVTANFSLDRRVAVLEEVVTTGYGTQRRLAITGSVSTIDADAANVGVPTNVTNLIQGRAAGVNITQNSGEPGAGAQIRIRGGTSISASNEPLYVIDGVPIANVETEAVGVGIGGSPPLPRNPMNLLNPSDIASISILKDAAATAIYGARAANGVILIETKKGPGGGPTMEYEFSAGRSGVRKHLEVLTGDQYRAFVDAEVAAGRMTAAQRAGLGTANTDWEDAITRSGSAFNHNLSFAGGSANTQYRASLNYLNQEGVVLSNGLKRYQARINGTHQAVDGKLRLGVNLTGSQVNNDYVPYENTGGFEGGVLFNSINFNPTYPIQVSDAAGVTQYYELGTGPQSVRNPVALAEQIQDLGKSTRVLGNASADLDIFSALTGRINVGVDRTDGTRRIYWPRISPVGAGLGAGGLGGLGRQDNRDNTSLTLQTLLTFHPEYSTNQTLEVVGGYEYNDYTRSDFGVEARGFTSDALGYNGLSGGVTVQPPASFAEASKLVSFFGRANWSMADRYFLTGVLRRDGASQFGIGNKWALFPAISGSVRLTETGFVPTGPFSELRLRAGWGKVGNPAVPPYASLILLQADGGSRYAFGDQAITGYSPFQNPNPNLKWEETAQTNVALDYGFMNNRFTGSLEYYVKKTNDLLLRVNVPQPAVAPDRLENIGSVKNNGIEFSLDAQLINSPSRNWMAGLVFSRDRNEVVSLGNTPFIITGILSGPGQSGAPSQRIIPGQPLGTFFGPEYAGVDAQGRQQFHNYDVTRDANGRETSRTRNGVTLSPGGDDFVIIGDANPNFTLGLRSQGNFGPFDASIQINSMQGMDVLNETALVYATKTSARQGKNFLASALNDGVASTDPSVYSDRWIEDGSFVRLQNITIGYTFNMPKMTGLAPGTRVFLSADNLALLTDYTGYDPEAHTDTGLASRGIDYLHYPRPRTFTVGARVAF
jgi:TonB-linked SusC/RagA family outer membrane protein